MALFCTISKYLEQHKQVTAMVSQVVCSLTTVCNFRNGIYWTGLAARVHDSSFFNWFLLSFQQRTSYDGGMPSFKLHVAWVTVELTILYSDLSPSIWSTKFRLAVGTLETSQMITQPQWLYDHCCSFAKGDVTECADFLSTDWPGMLLLCWRSVSRYLLLTLARSTWKVILWISMMRSEWVTASSYCWLPGRSWLWKAVDPFTTLLAGTTGLLLHPAVLQDTWW